MPQALGGWALVLRYGSTMGRNEDRTALPDDIVASMGAGVALQARSYAAACTGSQPQRARPIAQPAGFGRGGTPEAPGTGTPSQQPPDSPYLPTAQDGARWRMTTIIPPGSPKLDFPKTYPSQ